MSRSKLVKVNEKIADAVTTGFQTIEDAVVGSYKKIEDAFVERYLIYDGESVEEAKARLVRERAERETAAGENRKQ